MDNGLLKIFTFISVTLMALVAVIVRWKPELSTISPIIEKLYAAINNIFTLETEKEVNLFLLFVAITMLIVVGIMRSISNGDGILGGIRCVASGVFFVFSPIVVFCILGYGVVRIFFGMSFMQLFFKLSIIYVALSYLFCCILIFAEPDGNCYDCDHCNCDCDCDCW